MLEKKVVEIKIESGRAGKPTSLAYRPGGWSRRDPVWLSLQGGDFFAKRGEKHITSLKATGRKHQVRNEIWHLTVFLWDERDF